MIKEKKHVARIITKGRLTEAAYENEMTVTFKSKSVNEAFARSAVSAFALQLDPTIEEISDIKTAVSEAVTNCIVHAYDDEHHDIKISCGIVGDTVHIVVTDCGRGIDDIEKARQPFFSTKPDDERSGMGFTLIESFMDSLEIAQNAPNGLVVRMTKKMGSGN